MPVITKCYTPPTCTLEITAQTSALSRWMRQPAVRSVEFLLSFDGLSPEGQNSVEIRGDRDQLDTLSLTVNDYIGQLLAQTYTALPVAVPKLSKPKISESDDGPTLAPQNLMSTPTDAEHRSSTGGNLQLRSQTLLVHELELGSLATDTSGPKIPLTVSQLFDLASALDDCAEEMALLPEQLQPPERPQPRLRTPPAWARSAAVVVLMVGVTTATVKLYQTRQGPKPPSSISLQREQAREQSPTSSRSPSVLQETTPPQPSQSPLQGSPPLQSPSPRSSPDSSRSIPETRLTPPLADRARQPETSSPSTPSSPAQRPQQNKSLASTTTQPLAQSDSFGSQPRQKNSPVAKPEEAPPAPPVAPKDDSSVATVPESEVQSSRPDFADGAGESMESKAEADNSATLGRSLRSQPPAAIAPQPATQEALPQVTEVQRYVAQRWQAPKGLNQNLQYTLVLNPDGSLQRVEPLGTPAVQYLKQVPLPAINQRFVSPLKQAKSTKIRLILGPDGTVRTLLLSNP